MKAAQKIVISGLIIFCTVLMFASCSPDAQTAVPTNTIVIKNIPDVIFPTEANVADPISQPTYKVYVQLSKYMDADHGYTAKGEAKVADLVPENHKYTVTITDLKDPEGNPWSGADWLYESVVITPQVVNDIFDIDAKVGMIGPSTSSTVTFYWNSLLFKTSMDLAPGGNGIDSYKRLYGTNAHPYEGVILLDTDITITGDKTPADGITGFDQFTSYADNRNG